LKKLKKIFFDLKIKNFGNGQKIGEVQLKFEKTFSNFAPIFI
jgi:hypothetical protein